MADLTLVPAILATAALTAGLWLMADRAAEGAKRRGAQARRDGGGGAVMGNPLNLTNKEGAALYNLVDAYLRTEAVDADLPALRSARAKLNGLWHFDPADAVGRGDAAKEDR